jgi:ABC-type sulfate/molybdate transport systems ATPase subunit
MTVADNVAYGLRAAGRRSAETRERVRDMLELVQLPEKANKLPSELSGGERQRTALARALAVQPRVLLLDEAFAALDPSTRSEVVHEVREIIRRLKVTTLLITHDQEEAFLFSRRVLVLNQGKTVAFGTPEEIMALDEPFIRDFVKMIFLTRSLVEADASNGAFVTLAGGQRLAIDMKGVKPGDHVHVMIKKGPQADSFEVWPYDTSE